MQSIMFKKKLLGKWLRDDGELKKFVNEESMFREIEQLVNFGWSVSPHGTTHSRAYTVYRN